LCAGHKLSPPSIQSCFSFLSTLFRGIFAALDVVASSIYLDTNFEGSAVLVLEWSRLRQAGAGTIER